MQAFIGQNLLVRLVLDASLLTTLLKYNKPDSKLPVLMLCALVCCVHGPTALCSGFLWARSWRQYHDGIVLVVVYSFVI